MDRHLENCILRAANSRNASEKIKELLKDIQKYWDQEYWDTEDERRGAVYLLEDIERVLKELL